MLLLLLLLLFGGGNKNMEENESKQNNGNLDISKALAWRETILQYALHRANQYNTIEELRTALHRDMIIYNGSKIMMIERLMDDPKNNLNEFIKNAYETLHMI